MNFHAAVHVKGLGITSYSLWKIGFADVIKGPTFSVYPVSGCFCTFMWFHQPVNLFCVNFKISERIWAPFSHVLASAPLLIQAGDKPVSHAEASWRSLSGSTAAKRGEVGFHWPWPGGRVSDQNTAESHWATYFS